MALTVSQALALTQQLQIDGDKLRAIVQGDAATVVETEGGPVPSLAKRLAELAGDVGGPAAVGEIPVDRFGDAGGEVFLGGPAEFGLEFRAVDRVATVVAGAVSDVGDLGGVGFAVGARGFFVEEGADGVNDFDVRFFIQAPDVIGFAEATFLKDEPDGGGVVLDVEPVADLHAVAVHRQGLACQCVDDHQGDEFFRKMVRAVVVGAICREDGQTVGVVVGADQVV